jgi:hypothetical protein
LLTPALARAAAISSSEAVFAADTFVAPEAGLVAEAVAQNTHRCPYRAASYS